MSYRRRRCRLGSILLWSVVALNIACTAVFLAWVVTIPAPAPVAVCQHQNMVTLTTPNDVSEEFKVASISAVMPNLGAFTESAHSVILIGDNSRFAIKEDMFDIIQRINKANCAVAR